LRESLTSKKRIEKPEQGEARVASFPPVIDENPYQRLLYEALSAQGVRLVAGNRFRLSWLWENRGRVDVLHFHWPSPYYRHDRGPPDLRLLLSWIRLSLLALRLSAARLLRYRIVWTVHEVYPPETTSRRLDRAAATTLAWASDVLIMHDEATLNAAEKTFRRIPRKTVVIPHASFRGVYPPGRDRRTVRAELDVPPDAFVFLCFGHLRDYKDIDVLLEAFRAVKTERVFLVVAGLPMSQEAADTLRDAAETDARMRVLLGFVPNERVAELFEASDVAVVSRGDGGTSGVLVLALSLGVPVVAAACSAYESLTGHGQAGWHFRPGDPASLASALDEAAGDPEGVRLRAQVAADRGAAVRWEEAASLTAPVLRGA
jgi:glycosyltransferase involved in cell wall biosynthesis